jgi:hypothetical protein
MGAREELPLLPNRRTANRFLIAVHTFDQLHAGLLTALSESPHWTQTIDCAKLHKINAFVTKCWIALIHGEGPLGQHRDNWARGGPVRRQGLKGK